MGSERRKKSDRLYDVAGSLDELAAWIGFAASLTKEPRVIKTLRRLLQFLFCAGTDIATPLGQLCRRRINDEDTKALETIIDEFEKDLDDLRHFVLPIGSQAVSGLHIARAVARRAERETVKLETSEQLNQALLPFLNRLSSLLFVMARWLNHKEGREEEHPTYNP